MKNKLIACFCAMVILFSLTSCGEKQQTFSEAFGENITEYAQQEGTPQRDNEQPIGENGEDDATAQQSGEENADESEQDESNSVQSDETAPVLAVEEGLLIFMGMPNSVVKEAFGNEGFITIYWGGTPSIAYDITGNEDYITVFLDAGYDDIFAPFEAGGGLDATTNIWPDEYNVYAMLFSGLTASALFGYEEIITYDMLNNAIDDFPALQMSEPDDFFDFSVPYATYIVGDNKLELEFTEVNGEYELSLALVVQKDEQIDTLMLRV